MRVLQVAHALPSDTLGGTELYTKHLSESLARDHEVAIASPRGDGSCVDVPTYALPTPADGDAEGASLADLSVDDEAVDAQFVELLESFEPDVVHFQHLKSLSATLPERCRERGIACAATLHDFWTICHREQLFRPEGTLCSGPESVAKCADCFRAAAAGAGAAGSTAGGPGRGAGTDGGRVERRSPERDAVDRAVGLRADRLGDALSALDALISPSSFLRETFVEFGVAPARIHERRNGILTERFDDTGFDPEGPVRFAYAGRIAPLKGVHLLVDAFTAVDAPGAAEVELHVHGEFDPESDPYHARLRERADDRVRFHGRYDDPAAPYRGADVFVLPSVWYENSPIVIQESFASRVPVITGDIGGMAELVADGRDGLTFPAGDSAALADRLRRLVSDPARIARLREGIDPPKHLTENTAETVALYRRCLAGAGSADRDATGV